MRKYVLAGFTESSQLKDKVRNIPGRLLVDGGLLLAFLLCASWLAAR
jgi:hypothetical protein